jgi:hypothetical protein
VAKKLAFRLVLHQPDPVLSRNGTPGLGPLEAWKRKNLVDAEVKNNGQSVMVFASVGPEATVASVTALLGMYIRILRSARGQLLTI